MFGGFQDAGLRDLFAVIGVDDDSWTVIKECRDVHKSEALITELLIAFQCRLNKLYIDQLSAEDKEDLMLCLLRSSPARSFS